MHIWSIQPILDSTSSIGFVPWSTVTLSVNYGASSWIQKDKLCLPCLFREQESLLNNFYCSQLVAGIAATDYDSGSF